MTQRTDRIDELIRQEIGEIIAREISDPRIGFVTITDVETTRDLSHAKVSASFIGTAAERALALAALGHAMPFIRHELGKRLRIRRIPELHLQADDSLVRGTRVLQLINDLGSGADALIASSPEDTLPTPVARLPHEGDASEPDPPPALPDMPAHAGGDRRPGKRGRTRASTGPRGKATSHRRTNRS
ncbi:MAG: 30S ribosome-binding factor RbfA [Chloroflexota bacterium]